MEVIMTTPKKTKQQKNYNQQANPIHSAPASSGDHSYLWKTSGNRENTQREETGGEEAGSSKTCGAHSRNTGH
jgi:hypothetical protein